MLGRGSCGRSRACGGALAAATGASPNGDDDESDRGGEVGGGGCPASERPGKRVRDARMGSGSNARVEWRRMVDRNGGYLDVDLTAVSGGFLLARLTESKQASEARWGE